MHSFNAPSPTAAGPRESLQRAKPTQAQEHRLPTSSALEPAYASPVDAYPQLTREGRRPGVRPLRRGPTLQPRDGGAAAPAAAGAVAGAASAKFEPRSRQPPAAAALPGTARSDDDDEEEEEDEYEKAPDWEYGLRGYYRDLFFFFRV